MMEKNERKPDTGIVLVACLNFFFAIVTSVLAASIMLFLPLLAGTMVLKALALLIGGIGLWELKRWAWFLTVAMCFLGLIEFVLYPNAVPFELIVLPYLLIKRGEFQK